ncbi:hypothetical protein ACIA6C_28210 [Streptomyces sp. NPDC051578]|uniref:hypothetical protein n=1 Tax=Streptomyces sp. NPDC051578 TaxID=3365662 RepID=UPI0037AEB3DB
MAGYSTPYVLLQFPELGEDVSVLIRNPQLLAPAEVTPKDVPLDERGQPLDQQEAQNAMYEVFARVIVAWKVYDGSAAAPELTEDADPVALYESLNASPDAQPRLGPITIDNIARMPLRIINRIGEELGRVADPQ